MLAASKANAKLGGRIPARAIEEVRTYPEGRVLYPTATGELPASPKRRLGPWGEDEEETESDVEEALERLETSLEEMKENVKARKKEQQEYAKETITYEAEQEDVRPYYWKCSKTLNGESYMVDGVVADMTTPVRFLLDTGANMNILPLRIYERIGREARPGLEKTKYDIMVGNGETMKAEGIATLKVKFGEDSHEARFYVVREGDMAVLGTSFHDRLRRKNSDGTKADVQHTGYGRASKKRGGRSTTSTGGEVGENSTAERVPAGGESGEEYS